MPRKKSSVPVPRLHKPSGRARVYINGQYVYLGPWGSKEAEKEYRRIILESFVEAQKPQIAVTINMLVAQFLKWAEKHYVKPSGRPTGNTEQFVYAVRPLVTLYGDHLPDDFGPLALKAVREDLILSGLCRSTVNKRVDLIRQVFEWGVSNELVQETVYRALMTVKPLQPGKSAALERPPIPAVSFEIIKKTLEALEKTNPLVADMIRVQLLGGMRPNEVCQMRPCDIDFSDEKCWIYTPSEYKTEHHKGHWRTIALSHACQVILTPYLLEKEGQPESYLFSPKDAVKTSQYIQWENRKDKKRPSRAGHKKRNPKRTPGEKYNHRSYRKAVMMGIERAGVPHWSPNQLRHTKATEVENLFGKEAAQILLGHTSIKTTEIYLDPNAMLHKQIEAVKEVARKISNYST